MALFYVHVPLVHKAHNGQKNKKSDAFEGPLFYGYKEPRTMEPEGKGMEHRTQEPCGKDPVDLGP